MIRKYRVYYTWHSGECFGATMEHYDDYEIDDETDMNAWKKEFEDDDIDGSYCTINRMVVLDENEDNDI